MSDVNSSIGIFSSQQHIFRTIYTPQIGNAIKNGNKKLSNVLVISSIDFKAKINAKEIINP